jgi:hypothetical protein
VQRSCALLAHGRPAKSPPAMAPGFVPDVILHRVTQASSTAAQEQAKRAKQQKGDSQKGVVGGRSPQGR